jgi:ribosomal protein S30
MFYMTVGKAESMSKTHQKECNGNLDVIPFIARAMANHPITAEALESLSRQEWFSQMEEFRGREKKYTNYCRHSKMDTANTFRKAVRLLAAAGYDHQYQGQAESAVRGLIAAGWPGLYHFVMTSAVPLEFDAFCLLKQNQENTEKGKEDESGRDRTLHGKLPVHISAEQKKKEPPSVSNGEFCLFLYLALDVTHKKIRDQTPRFARHFKKCSIEQSIIG